jgi:UDP-N-acetylglucosamine 1-carboxyvinyltransferase
MDKMRINGGKTLSGEVSVSGAKNSALPLIFSTLLAPGSHRLTNVPKLRDIDSSQNLMNSLGCQTEYKDHTLTIQVPQVVETLAHYDQVRKMRASILVLGPLLARFKTARVSLPGGCAIGARPIGMHLDALEKMGAHIEVDGGYVMAQTDQLKGAVIDLPFATVGGTENIMMAASLAQGETIINNAAREPEIEDLANYLNSMGAKVSGAGSTSITIRGVSQLQASTHSVIPDRIEAGTLVTAAAITKGDVHVTDCEPKHLAAFIEALKDMGVPLEITNNSIHVRPHQGLKSKQITTEPYPGYPTDLQAQMMALMTQASGQSQITEKVFENRFMHVSELLRMGAQIEIQDKTAKVTGGVTLKGAPVMATDLRASASLILAALVAEGETIVNRIYHLDRGYENLEGKLSQLGASVERI